MKKYLEFRNEIDLIAKKYGRNPSEITLIAVTKERPWQQAAPLYESGCRDFAENRLQEALLKISEAPPDIHWHLIGTLQSNKVAKALPLFTLIHSVDSIELVKKISFESVKQARVTRILLQANTSKELTKHGLTAEEWKRDFDQIHELPGISIEGLMTIAPFTQEEKVIRSCFANLRDLRDDLERTGAHLPHLSMGMSNDYPYAIAEGATLLRIGTALF